MSAASISSSNVSGLLFNIGFCANLSLSAASIPTTSSNSCIGTGASTGTPFLSCILFCLILLASSCGNDSIFTGL